MRKFYMAVLFALLTVSVVQVPAYAAMSKTQDEALQVKKKKLALQKAAVAKKQEATLAKLKADKAKVAKLEKFKAEKAKAAAAKLKADRTRVAGLAPRRACGSFMKCLFGSTHRRTSVSVAGLAGTGLSGNSLSETVAWNETKYTPGTLIVKTPERALYYVLGNGEAIRYSIGVGREGFQWGGRSKIVAKTEWPTWHPPAEMIKREALKGHMLPEMMEGGPGNPLGARAMYIGGTIYRVHGTNNEASIGGAVSSGCIRMMNADVIDLYARVKIGSPIFVYQ